MAVDPAWQNSLMQQLQQAQYYPSGARARQEQGTVILSFTVDRDGHVLVHDIAHSSGFPELDKEAGAMLMRAKLPAFPASMPQKRIDLTIPIRFALPASPPPAADRIESKRSATDQLIENKRQIDRLIGTDESRAQSGSRRNEKVEAQNSSNPAYPQLTGKTS